MRERDDQIIGQLGRSGLHCTDRYSELDIAAFAVAYLRGEQLCHVPPPLGRPDPLDAVSVYDGVIFSRRRPNS